ncbi:acylphosphatase [Hansschlegelia zhihuaiae]|uniref:acylphosphatase n=1 Tax=Hansschlegelia zhihuaiae TaxID=405005 RepID=A0A4Q0MMI7_9HYPH|nr:acylphosphatase [Hansschlegelia zhihuaiae]RXF74944.1 acylphosphatase [Hansschlegelia zhihuaiae]
MSDTVERFRVTGLVQGVFYRKWAQANAEGLGLRGFVRNMGDGSVEAVLAGPKERLDAFAEACLAGPPNAKVEKVTRSAADEDDLPKRDGVEIADDG